MVEAVVVDDSHFMRAQIRKVLEEGGVTVVGEARNGVEAIEAVHEHEPDIVTMDVKMPGMDGIEAVERIMETRPTPVLMLSRYTDGRASTTFEALEAGAVDVFMKPDGEVSPTLAQYATDLVEKVTVVARADVSEPGSSAVEPKNRETGQQQTSSPPTIVIAASTGGPPEVQSILTSLPPTLDCRVLVVQHMPENFTGRFATRLDALSDLAVFEASSSGTVGPNEAVVARGDHHLEVRGDDGTEIQFALTGDEPVHSVRPAADITFESVATVCTPPLVGIVLSGMGADGATGVEQLSNAGGTVIAQEPESASISAMPQRAIETGAVDDVLPVSEMPEAIIDAVTE